MGDKNLPVPPTSSEHPVAVPTIASGAEERRRQQTGQAAYAKNTRRSYEGAWARFIEWCAGRRDGATHLPAHHETVEHFLRGVQIYDRNGQPTGVLPSLGTLSLYRAVIHRAHQRAQLPSPFDHPELQEWWKGLRRERGAHQQGAAPLTLDLLERIIPRLPEGPKGARDRAVLTWGTAAALRRSELCGVRIAHVKFRSGGILLYLPKRKTDQVGEGTDLGTLLTGDPVLCPAAALRGWLQLLADGGEPVGPSDPVFRAVSRGGRIRRPDHSKPRAGGLHPESVSTIVKDAVELVGENRVEYSAHSLRSGFVTSADALGYSIAEIMEQTGHKTERMILHYTRHRRALKDNITGGMFRGDRKRRT